MRANNSNIGKQEIVLTDFFYGLKDALTLTKENVKCLSFENVHLIDSIDRVAASDIYAVVDSPSVDASLKDGYAVISHEVKSATDEKPVRLLILGSATPGDDGVIQVTPGTTVRLSTGARIPVGADAVVPEEFVKHKDSYALIGVHAEPGRNILLRGSDVSSQKCLIESGRMISPSMVGLLAAGGHSTVPVFKTPNIGIIGIGDEIVEPGKPLKTGKLYASNIMTVACWCIKYKMKARMTTANDDYSDILNTLKTLSEETDVIITSGGAWTSDHDFIEKVLEGLGWKKIFHRIRIGPGKAVGFGILNGKPLFILSGGPASNFTGFTQIVLPGLLTISGHRTAELPSVNAILASEIRGRNSEWTDFFYGHINFDKIFPTFYPFKERTRLASISEATTVASIPEGQECIPAGSTVCVQLLK